jgi:hypothetical protein
VVLMATTKGQKMETNSAEVKAIALEKKTELTKVETMAQLMAERMAFLLAKSLGWSTVTKKDKKKGMS